MHAFINTLYARMRVDVHVLKLNLKITGFYFAHSRFAALGCTCCKRESDDQARQYNSEYGRGNTNYMLLMLFLNALKKCTQNSSYAPIIEEYPYCLMCAGCLLRCTLEL
jgi:hypothetical protein